MFNFDATWRKIHNVIIKTYYISDHDIHRLLRKIHYTVYKQYSNINSNDENCTSKRLLLQETHAH